jgi:hypothetical protein
MSRFAKKVPDAKDLIDAAIEHTNEQLGMLTKQGGFIPSATFNRVRSHVKKENSHTRHHRRPHPDHHAFMRAQLG